MAIHYRTKGLILKKENLREADRIFVIYTQDFGKLEILGKAIRKIKSKLRGGTELFYLSEIEFIQGKTYKTLTDVALIEKFENIRKDLKKLKIAYRISEVLDNLIKGQEPDEKIWLLLNETFPKLNNQQLTVSDQQLLYYYFLWNLFSILGYQPELYNCLLCQKKLTPEKLYFSPEEGGITCSSCFKKLKKESLKIEPEIIKILRIILKKDWLILSKLKFDKNHEKSLKSISESYLNHVLAEIK